MTDKPALDLDKIRARLDSARGPLYWKSLEELAETEEFQAFAEDEFAEITPKSLRLRKKVLDTKKRPKRWQEIKASKASVSDS